jgi:DNA/RNA endonuclease YhcR with UshA esterase domain
MTRAGYALVALFLSFGLGAPVSAHHSFAAHYDMSNAVTVQGTIAKVQLTNPHSWFFIDVKDADGKTTRWSFEAGTPSGMIRNGYKSSELPPGTMVTITGFKARDKADTGMLSTLTTADGKAYGMFGPKEGGATK